MRAETDRQYLTFGYGNYVDGTCESLAERCETFGSACAGMFDVRGEYVIVQLIGKL